MPQKGQITKHNFFHTTRIGEFLVVCQYCDLIRHSAPLPIGYYWERNSEIFLKKPPCITRKIQANETETT